MDPDLLILEGFTFLVGAPAFQTEAMADREMFILRVILSQIRPRWFNVIAEVGKAKAKGKHLILKAVAVFSAVRQH